MKIVSLLPSATEIICALGLSDELVGVTHECDYPPSVTRLPKVTRTLIPHKDEDRLRVVFLEWIDPLFNAGHWTPELIELAGGIDCIGYKYRPSETTPWRSIVDAEPDVLVIACCGYSAIRTLSDMPILQKQPGWDNLPCVRQNRVYLIDGSTYFNRPGPRLVDSLEIIAHTLYPDVHPLPPGLPPAVTYRPN